MQLMAATEATTNPHLLKVTSPAAKMQGELQEHCQPTAEA